MNLLPLNICPQAHFLSVLTYILTSSSKITPWVFLHTDFLLNKTNVKCNMLFIMTRARVCVCVYVSVCVFEIEQLFIKRIY